MIVLEIYLLFCLACFVIPMLWFIGGDIVHGPDPKFGFNVMNPLCWMFALALSIPIVQFVGAYFIWDLLFRGKK
jgi:hypothetical protein